MVASENEFCKNPTSKNTITTIDSESYGSIGGHKHSLDQDTGRKETADDSAGLASVINILRHRWNDASPS
jgi:hypothetical protein